MPTRKILSICLAMGPWLGLSAPAFSQNYVFTKILDNSTLRPDGAGPFNITAVTTPAFDGQRVVFRDDGNKDDGSLAAIWSFNTLDGTFQKLVDLKMRVPGTAATFTDIQLLDTAPAARKGTVVFVAHDSRPSQNSQGLYSVPAAGGPISRIADFNTANPSGGVFTVFDLSGKQAGGFSFDGANVVFNAQGSALTLGNYVARPDGSSLALIADTVRPYSAPGDKVQWFRAPVISGGNIVMVGASGLDTGTAYNGLYLGSTTGNGAVTELLNSTQRLPGAPNSGFHTRFDAPVIAVDGTLVAFRADDSSTASSAAPLYGLYWTDLTSHSLNRIADVNSPLPGLGRLRSIADGGVAVSQGNVLFKAADDTAGYPGNSALYLWRNGAAARIIGSGDHLDGGTVQVVRDAGPASLYASGFAFNAEFSPVRGQALYVAIPAANSVSLTSVTNAASYAASSIAPGEIVTLFGSGMGPATLAMNAPDAGNRFPTSLAGVRVLVNGISAPLIYAGDKQIAAIVPFGVANQPTASIHVEYNGIASSALTVAVTNTMPGLFSADGSGSGPGAIQNADFGSNSATNPAVPGSIIVLYASGLGPLSPAQPDGSIVGTTGASLVYPVTVKIGGQTAVAAYQGPAPLAVAGLYQINCIIPPGLASGPATVIVTSDGRQSQANLTVAIR